MNKNDLKLYHCKTIREIRWNTALYNSVINSVYTVDGLRIRTGSDTEFVYCVDGVYDGVMRCCISPSFTYGFAVYIILTISGCEMWRCRCLAWSQWLVGLNCILDTFGTTWCDIPNHISITMQHAGCHGNFQIVYTKQCRHNLLSPSLQMCGNVLMDYFTTIFITPYRANLLNLII